jgi:hypothetical protein
MATREKYVLRNHDIELCGIDVDSTPVAEIKVLPYCIWNMRSGIGVYIRYTILIRERKLSKAKSVSIDGIRMWCSYGGEN